MSISQIIVILIIALIVLGPDKLPMVARTVGKIMAEFRRITGDFRSTIEGEMREIERETSLKEIRENFPAHIHYDLQTQEQTQEATVAAGEPAAPPSAPEPAPLATAEAEAPTPSGKPSNGERTPA